MRADRILGFVTPLLFDVAVRAKAADHLNKNSIILVKKVNRHQNINRKRLYKY